MILNAIFAMSCGTIRSVRNCAARPFLVFMTFALLCLFTTASLAQIVQVKVNGTINPVTEEYIGRAIDSAEQSRADAVLIELRTPGGLVDSTRGIISKILAS